MTSVRVSHILSCSEANGPGKRFALWVQGCRGVPQLSGATKHCESCWNRHTWSRSAGEVMSQDEVFARVERAVREHGIEGVTFSGGEPFQQAASLAELARHCQEQGLNVVVFTGYTYEFLASDKAPEGAGELLRYVDMLVDGPYTAILRRENLPLRGSANQRLIPLSKAGKKLAARVTNELPVIEFNFTNGQAAVTGFPVALKEVLN